MSLPRTSMRSFLVQAKARLSTAIGSGQKITFVIGNESADLDSLSSSLLFAYIRTSAPPSNAFSPFYIPITNIPASDLSIRPEFLALLPHANLEPSHLITLDDLPKISEIESKLAPDITRWLLVDHNSLQGSLGKIYSLQVRGTIDHHDDERKVPHDTGIEPRIIMKSGSCSSLVTNYCRESWDRLSSSASSSIAEHSQCEEVEEDATFASVWDAQAAKLALAAILIDTNNLKSKDKTTEQDTEAVRYLEAKISVSPQGSKRFDRDSFFNEISKAKQDIESLSVCDILRKDYKEWTEGDLKLGISSVVKPIDFLISKGKSEAGSRSKDSEPFLNTVKQYIKDQGLDLFGIMTTGTSAKGEFQRELLVWALKPDSVAAVKKFEKQSGAELGLKSWQDFPNDIDRDSDGEWRKIWLQEEVQHSRKRVGPLLREAMN